MAQVSSDRSSTGNRSNHSLALSSTQKQPSFDTTALAIVPSPLMTSSLDSRNSATSAEESVYLTRAKWLRWSRLLLAVLIIATGIAATACTGHVIQRYNSTHLGPDFHLPLWPLNVDLRPALAILISAAIATTGTMGYVAFSFIPTVSITLCHPRNADTRLTFFFSPIPALFCIISSSPPRR